jgi:hypothetical protein
MGMSTINIGECESQLAWGKKKFVWERRAIFLHAYFGTTRESRVLELGGNNGGHVSSCLELLKTEEASC